jgi:hypothetical protein
MQPVEGNQVANTRHGHAGGKSTGPPRRSPATARARERIAAERAARKRAEARRRLLMPIASVSAVLAIIGALVAVKLTSAPPAASESLASPSIITQVTTVPAAVLTRVRPGQATPMQTVQAPGPPHTGEESHCVMTWLACGQPAGGPTAFSTASVKISAK